MRERQRKIIRASGGARKIRELLARRLAGDVREQQLQKWLPVVDAFRTLAAELAA
jgi:hypothetical protein